MWIGQGKANVMGGTEFTKLRQERAGHPFLHAHKQPFRTRADKRHLFAAFDAGPSSYPAPVTSDLVAAATMETLAGEGHAEGSRRDIRIPLSSTT